MNTKKIKLLTLIFLPFFFVAVRYEIVTNEVHPLAAIGVGIIFGGVMTLIIEAMFPLFRWIGLLIKTSFYLIKAIIATVLRLLATSLNEKESIKKFNKNFSQAFPKKKMENISV